ncbi:hypothetical protein FNV43_RR18387 [Rhamnella rubrinervis]|uniref:PCI domain-containing protein n=1 Tax=Rhamnella rubrinervis TaxID=2594499 RepID=A0A8K0GVN5_9ROSA|nr:hypothetical protein FNV43_RR18387 [Rhamnella rubrinervis]
MDIEQKQAELIDHFVKQASAVKGSALGSLVAEATSNPSLLPSLRFSPFPLFSSLKELIILYTWMCCVCLHMVHGVITRVLPYDQLMQELDVSNVRELEDFLINECMYAGIVRGKLDQLRRCFEVQFAAGRDLRPEQLGSMIQTLSNWLTTSDNLLVSIQDKIKWADTMSQFDNKHRKDIEDKVEEVKKTISLKGDGDFRGHEEIFSEPGGVMDYEEDRPPKRRRHPIS